MPSESSVLCEVSSSTVPTTLWFQFGLLQCTVGGWMRQTKHEAIYLFLMCLRLAPVVIDRLHHARAAVIVGWLHSDAARAMNEVA